MPCSLASDRIGRKPVILLGTVGMAISIALFGMSKSYWAMVTTRCIGGMLGGVWASVRLFITQSAIIDEIINQSDQSDARRSHR